MKQPIHFETWSAVYGKKIGYACLNLPEQLNALNLTMIQMLTTQLLSWKDDPSVVCVVLDGQGEKAFCAGGDVRQLYEAAKQDGDVQEKLITDFFTQEYQLDYLIHQYEKPILVWGDGIVMGGGLGLMVGASHRVVTERTRIAMPEVTIGLYPDVGGSYFLNKMPGKTGLFLGLTGYRMSAADAQYVGLADRMLDASQKQTVLDLLKHHVWSEDVSRHAQDLTHMLTELAKVAEVRHQQSVLQSHQDLICELMDGELQDIENRHSTFVSQESWLQRSLKTMQTGSPLSRALVWHQHKLGQDLTLAEAFQLEVMLSVNCCIHGDFVEGVRAQLIDKDFQPSWQAFEGIEPMLKQPWPSNPLRHLST